MKRKALVFLFFIVPITILTAEMVEVGKFQVNNSTGRLQTVSFFYDTDSDELLLYLNSSADIFVFSIKQEMRQSIIGYLDKGRELFQNSQQYDKLIQETMMTGFFQRYGEWYDAGYISTTFKYQNFSLSGGESTGGVHIMTDRFTSSKAASINGDFPGIILLFNNIDIFDNFQNCFRQDYIQSKINA